MWLSIVLEIAFSKPLPSGGFLIKTKIGKTYLGKTAKGHHFEVSGGDSQSKTANGQDFKASRLNRQHNSWPTTPSSWPKDSQDGPSPDDLDTGPQYDDKPIQPVHQATTTTTTATTTTTTTPTTTTTTPPTTPGWTETTTTKDSWPPRTTTSAGKGWVHWTKMIQGHHYLWIMEYDVDLNEIMQQWQSTAFHV